MSAGTQLVCPSAPTRTCAELLAALALIVASVVVLRSFDPASSVLFPPCPLHWLTGLYCPGCGSLRAIHQLLRGNLAGAFAFNPFAVLALPFLAYGGLSYAVLRMRGRRLPHVFLPSGWIWTLGVAIVVFGIARNIPMYPFSLLAPGAMLAR